MKRTLKQIHRTRTRIVKKKKSKDKGLNNNEEGLIRRTRERLARTTKILETTLKHKWKRKWVRKEIKTMSEPFDKKSIQ